MRHSRLVELLQTFSPQERQRLRLFVVSPYFSPGGNPGALLTLLDTCLAALENPDETWPDKAAVYALVFPDETPVAGKLEKRMSALHALAMQFLAVEQYLMPENEPEVRLVQARELQNKGLLDRSSAVLDSFLQRNGHMQKRDSKQYLNAVKHTLLETNLIILRPSRVSPISLNQGFEALYLFYQAMKLEMGTSIGALRQRYAFQPSEIARYMLDETPVFPELAQMDPLLYLENQYLALMARSKPDQKGYDTFVRMLREYAHKLSQEELKRAWAMARNILIIWWNEYKSMDVGRAYFQLGLECLSNGMLYYHGAILHHALESLCKIACETGEPEVAYQILQDHRGKITGETNDEPFYRYNMARYLMYTGAQDEALTILPHSTPDASYQMNFKVLEIQLLYETNSDMLPYRMDALRLYLRRGGARTCPPDRLRNIRLFLNSLARICRCPIGNADRAARIEAGIRAAPRTTDYYWLLRKAAERGQRIATDAAPLTSSDGFSEPA